MAPKSIEISHADLKSAFATLQQLGLKPGPDATVALDGTVAILPGTCDRLVEAYISDRPPVVAPAVPAARPVPHRHDRRVNLPQWAELRLLQRHRAFLAAVNEAGEDAIARRRALADWQDYRRRLRLSIIHDYAQGDVVHGNTYCYGGELDGAHQLDQPTGETIRCDRLIHYTHPVNPEDLHLREANVWCAEIYRYHMPGLDDGPWAAQNEPLQAITPESYREMLVLRIGQMK
jgi:hypothetical protein